MHPRRSPLALWAGLCLLLLPGLSAAQIFRFTTLDIGQGDSAVLVAPGGCAVLFDGGPTGSGTTIKAYLKSIGVTRIDLAFNSHFHEDHLGGLDEVDVGTDAVPITAVYDRGGTYSSSAFTSYASHFSGKRNTAQLGQTFSLCGQVTLKVVAVNGNGVNSSDENAKSLVVKISYGDFDALVGGDLVGTAPNDIESVLAPDVGPVELYKVHHHGSKYSSTDTFLNALQPTVSFISVGIGNTYGHPTPECLSRLSAHGSDLWQTEDPATNTKRGHLQLTSTGGYSFTVTQGTTSVVYPTQGTVDATPPTAPGALVATAASDTEIDLSWNASTDNVGVSGYRVYRSLDGTTFSLVATTTLPGLADVGLSSSTPYTYRATAVDAAGNESTPSNTATATTGTPTVTVTSPNGGESWAGGTSHALTWNAAFLANVKLEYSSDNGATWTVIANSVPASSGSYPWTVPGLATSQARVRISDAVDGAPSDTNDAPFTVTAGTPAKVILNEILANEPGSDTAGEFIELVNVGGTSLDISGWTLSDATSVRHTFASGTVLGAGKALVVYGGALAIPAGVGNAVASSTGTLSLNNSGDTVTLKNGTTSVDSYAYASALAAVDGVSMNRNPDASATGTFVLHTSLTTASASPGTHANGSAF